MLLQGLYLAIMILFLLVAVFAYCYTFYGVRVFGTRVESAKRGDLPKGKLLEKGEVKKEEKKEEKKESKEEERKIDSEHDRLKIGS